MSVQKVIGCGCVLAPTNERDERDDPLFKLARVCSRHAILAYAGPISRSDVRWYTQDGLDSLAEYLSFDPGPDPGKVAYLVSAVREGHWVVGECSACGHGARLYAPTWAAAGVLPCLGRSVPEFPRSRCGAVFPYDAAAGR